MFPPPSLPGTRTGRGVRHTGLAAQLYFYIKHTTRKEVKLQAFFSQKLAAVRFKTVLRVTTSWLIENFFFFSSKIVVHLVLTGYQTRSKA